VLVQFVKDIKRKGKFAPIPAVITHNTCQNNAQKLQFIRNTLETEKVKPKLATIKHTSTMLT
jgi:hypothetical protein